MNKPSQRSRQIADLIQHQIAVILKKEINDPRLQHVTITSVDVSPDLRNAKIFFALPDVAKLSEVEKAFAKASGFLRSQLAERIDLRYAPNIRFVFDESLERGSKISALIEKALTEDARKKGNLDSDEDGE